MALIAENERVGTAIARTDTVVLRIPRTVIHRILDEYPDLAVCLHRKISASVLDTLKETGIRSSQACGRGKRQ